MGSESNTIELEQTDFDRCDAEPVNTPGAIQPFGALVVLAGQTVVNWSANLGELLAIPTSAPINFLTLFDEAARSSLEAALTMRVGDGVLPTILLKTRSGRPFNILAHRRYGCTILELEPARDDSESRAQFDYDLAALLALLDGAATLVDVCDEAVRTLRSASGYDRVMIYKFHEDMHGEVIAEAVSADHESWLGLHYPATDIPHPAREIFLLNKLRIIPDVNYVPVPIRGSGSTTLDLGRSLLRSASPVHIEYLKNMRVSASLTVSLKIRGALWGLIAFHHYDGPRLPPFAQRQAYAMAGDCISAAIGRRIEDEVLAERERVREVERTLRMRMGSFPQLTEALTGGEVTALDLMSAGASGVAIRYANAWTTKGVTPDTAELEELGRWLETRISDEHLAVESLSETYEASRPYASIASGLLAISVPDAANALILWFKPETLRMVTWGGDPTKRQTSASGRLHPRESFAAWKETVVRRSLPWKRWEIEAAAALHDSVISARLQYQYERERVARAEAERAKRTREEFMAVISHDLRNPLSSVMLNVALLGKISEQLSAPTVTSIVASMDRATKQMLWLINGLLDVAQAESGKLDLDVRRVSATGLVNNAVNVISPVAQAAHVVLQTHLPATEVFVRCDEQRIMQVLSNLIGNAIKFTPPHGQITLLLETSATTATFEIVDTGPGISNDQLPHIFDRFWRGANITHVQGVGLGLSIVKAIITAHQQEVKVNNRQQAEHASPSRWRGARVTTSLRDELRLMTRCHHDAIEAGSTLIRHSVTVDDYIGYLCAVYGYYAVLEPRLVVGDLVFCNSALQLDGKRKMARLESDIRALRGGEYSKSIPICRSHPLIDSASSVVGCSYVIEGATLGAAVIYRHVHKCLGVTPESGASFIFGYGRRTGDEWKRYVQAIENRAFDRTQREQCVAAAIATFETMRAWFTDQLEPETVG